MKDLFEKYGKHFSPKRFISFVEKRIEALGIQTCYTALLLYYSFKRKETPYWAKNIVVGTLGYLLSPIDLLPDLTPFIGFTDDIGVLAVGLITIAGYIDDSVKVQSRTKLGHWFPKYEEGQLEEVDRRL